MKHILLAFILICSTYSFGQKTNFQISIHEKSVGKNLQNNSEIKGTEYIFPNRIHEAFLDAASGFLTVQLRGVSKGDKWLNNTGHILQYDLNEQKLMWSKKIAYQTSRLQQFENVMIYTVGNKSSYLDIHTGKELWQTKNNIYHIDPFNRIGIGYKSHIGGYKSKNELEGIDLDNGDVLWKIDLNREYGWNDTFYDNDSTLIVVAAGLHSINVINGDGWDYEAITGRKDYSGTVAANVVGVALGLLTGTFVVTTGYDLVHGLVSNVLVDDLYFYFSTKEELVKIDKQTGEIIWEQAFPKDLTSKSSIFENNNKIFMINEGIAFMGNQQIDFGKPFIAAFDRETGEQAFLSTIEGKREPIRSFLLMENEILLMFKDRLAKYSKETGKFIMERNFHKNDFGENGNQTTFRGSELKSFVGNQTFIVNENDKFICLPQTDTNKIFVLTNKGTVLILNNQLDITNTIESEELNISYLETENHKFIVKDKDSKTWIIDNSGEKIAEIEASSNAFLIDKILYNTQQDRFIAIDLEGIIR